MLAANPIGEDVLVHELAITVIGHDRPGIIADTAEVLAALELNLTDSTMTRLRGHRGTCTCSSRRWTCPPQWTSTRSRAINRSRRRLERA